MTLNQRSTRIRNNAPGTLAVLGAIETPLEPSSQSPTAIECPPTASFVPRDIAQASTRPNLPPAGVERTIPLASVGLQQPAASRGDRAQASARVPPRVCPNLGETTHADRRTPLRLIGSLLLVVLLIALGDVLTEVTHL